LPFLTRINPSGWILYDNSSDAVVYMARSWLMETILLSICLEHGKMIEEILGKLKEKDA